jgi:hypothetical protein
MEPDQLKTIAEQLSLMLQEAREGLRAAMANIGNQVATVKIIGQTVIVQLPPGTQLLGEGRQPVREDRGKPGADGAAGLKERISDLTQHLPDAIRRPMQEIGNLIKRVSRSFEGFRGAAGGGEAGAPAETAGKAVKSGMQAMRETILEQMRPTEVSKEAVALGEAPAAGRLPELERPAMLRGIKGMMQGGEGAAEGAEAAAGAAEGMAGVAEEAGVAAAGLGGIASAAGGVVIAIIGVGVAIGAAIKGIQMLGSAALNAQRYLAEFSPAQQVIFAMKEQRDFMREMKRGESLGPSTEKLMQANADLSDALEPIESTFTKLWNYVRAELSTAGTWIIKSLGLDKLFEYLGKKLDEIAGNTDKDKDTVHASDWLSTISDTTQAAVKRRDVRFRPIILPR